MNWLSAILAFLKALIGMKPDEQLTEQKHATHIAECQAALLADRTRPTVDDRLSRGDF